MNEDDLIDLTGNNLYSNQHYKPQRSTRSDNQTYSGNPIFEINENTPIPRQGRNLHHPSKSSFTGQDNSAPFKYYLSQSQLINQNKKNSSMDEKELQKMLHDSTLDISSSQFSNSRDRNSVTDSSKEERSSIDLLSVDSCSSYGGASNFMAKQMKDNGILEGELLLKLVC